MAWDEPRVKFSEHEFVQPALESLTAVPVFIGFTAASTETLLPLSSWEEFLDLRLIGALEWTHSPLAVAVHLFFDNGGTNAWVLSAGTKPVDVAAMAQALQAAVASETLAGESQITLLCAPDIVSLEASGTPGILMWREVWQALLDVCQSRRGNFTLLDLPSDPGLAVPILTDAFSLRYAEFGASYWPHLETRYRFADQWVVTTASGAVAAVMQQTDVERGVWKAPANVALDQVVRPQYALPDGQAVFQQSVSPNLIRSFPGRGVRIWGCQTLLASTTSPWRFVQVRRLMSHIEARLTAVSRFCVFEPNNEITWFKLKSVCRNVLRTLWLNGALFGTSEEDAFRLYVGLGESMTQDDIVAGQLILKAEVAALYPAQFVSLSVRFNRMETEIVREVV